MKLFIVLFTLFVQAFMQKIITIDEVLSYKKEILYSTDIYEPKTFYVDYSTNNLYLSYQKDQAAKHHPARLNLDTRELTDIAGVTGRIAMALTVDQKTHDVFMGGDDGIYKYNISNNEAELIVNATGGVFDMSFKDRLYYVNGTSNYVYILVNGTPARTHRFNRKTYSFLIDDEDYMYSVYGFFFNREKRTDHVFYNGDIFIHAINMDRNGKVYACTRDGIYEIMKDSKATFKKVASLDAIGLAIAFDKENNFILAEYHIDEGYRIVRLIKSIVETANHTTIAPKNVSENNNCLVGYNRDIANFQNEMKAMMQNLTNQLARIESSVSMILNAAQNSRSNIHTLDQQIAAIETDRQGEVHVQRSKVGGATSIHLDVQNIPNWPYK